MIDILKIAKFYGMTPQNFKRTYLDGSLYKKRIGLAMISYYLFRANILEE